MKAFTLYFYGALAGATKRNAEQLARAAGFRVARSLRDSLDYVVLGGERPLAQTRAALAQEFDQRSRDAFERGELKVVSETDFLKIISQCPILIASD